MLRATSLAPRHALPVMLYTAVSSGENERLKYGEIERNRDVQADREKGGRGQKDREEETQSVAHGRFSTIKPSRIVESFPTISTSVLLTLPDMALVKMHTSQKQSSNKEIVGSGLRPGDIR